MAKSRAAYLLVLVLAACSTKPEATTEQPKVAEPTPSLAPGAASAGAGPTAASPSGPVRAGGLTWNVELPLEQRTPKSKMRVAEYGLAADPQAELSVFYFGPGQGGDVDANIARWLGQLTQPDGSDTAKSAKRSERKVGGLNVTLVEATGTFSGGMAMPGAPAPAAQADAMLLGAIASGPEGPVFFKLVGKRSSLESARTAFDALIGSLRPAS